MNYRSLVPDDSFIAQYMDLQYDAETPFTYDFWGAMWCIGAVCGRSVYVDRPQTPVHLNWYITFVAESGVTRKSTAVRTARQFVQAAHENAPFVEGRVSPEQLETMLATRKPSGAIICVSELATLLGREHYTRQMPKLLTDLYDCPALRVSPGTLSRGELTMHDVFVMFLSASTPSWLSNAVNPDVVEGGFTSRCIFVVADRRKKKVPWPVAVDPQAYIRAVHSLEALKFPGATAMRLTDTAIRLTDGAHAKFSSWYRNRVHNVEPYLVSFESREDAHVLRLAACLCINDNTWIICKGHVSNAIKIINHEKRLGSQLFEGGLQTSEVQRGINKVISTIIDVGPNGISHTKLYVKCKHKMGKDQFHMLMELMIEMHMVDAFVVNDPRRTGPVPRVYRGTRYLTTRALQVKLVEGMML